MTFVKRNYVITTLLFAFILVYACVVITGPGETAQSRLRVRVRHGNAIHGYAALRQSYSNKSYTIAKTKPEHLADASNMVPGSVVYRTLGNLQFSATEGIDVGEVKTRPPVAQQERIVSLGNVSDIIHMVNSIYAMFH